MKKFIYKILNPGGNKTALVIGGNYSNIEKKKINDFVLNENLSVEQVGFLSTDYNRLEMAGGEFCVNATRCAIWEYLRNKNENEKIKLEVSGLNDKVDGGMIKKDEVYAKLKIRKNLSEFIEVHGIYNYIKLDGILLIVIDEKNSKKYINNLKKEEQKAKEELKNIMKKIETNENAIGIILLEKYEKNTKIYPVIWVKTIDTLFYETACGSGSLSAAIYKFYISKETNYIINQPSGYNINIVLNIKHNQEYIEDAVISGIVIEEGEIKNGKI